MAKKTVVISLLLFLFFISGTKLFARNIVVPTSHGYAVVHSSAVAPVYYPTATWAYFPYRGYYYHPYVLAFPAQLPGFAVYPCYNTYWHYANHYGYSLAAARVDLNIRSEPRVAEQKGANVIATLRGGEQVYLLSYDGNWAYVQSVYAPFRRGYVYSKYLYSIPTLNYYYSAAY